MPDNANEKVVIVGAGAIARDYAKVLAALDIPFDVVGRGAESADSFHKETGIRPSLGMKSYLRDKGKFPDKAIVAVNVDTLSEVTKGLVRAGSTQILLEKPGAQSPGELRKLAGALPYLGEAKIYLAYNRRFFASTLRAGEIISDDGGLTSFHFDFTEWCNKIDTEAFPAAVLANWFLANSSHVADLAFYLGGTPQSLTTHSAGKDEISWHPQSSVFCGSGVTETGVLFSYEANWASAGRWSLELRTRRRKLIFCPMEQLKQQMRNSVAIGDITLDDSFDRNFKPGFYRQVLSFLGDKKGLLSLDGHVRNCEFYQKIADEA